MPELPEVEVLARHLEPLLINKTIHNVEVRRERVIAPTAKKRLKAVLRGAAFAGISRRGKYLLFTLRRNGESAPVTVVGHLGMTGRMYLVPARAALPKHAAVVLGLGRERLVFEDTRYFGRFTLDTNGISRLGPEPLGSDFTAEYLASALKRSAQAIKVKLLDQTLVAGIGNIYASEALFHARISPRLAARKLSVAQIERLRNAIREVLARAIKLGSTLPLDYARTGARDGLFYYGGAEGNPGHYEERLLVYDRRGQRCVECGAAISRLVQAARSTFYCPHCQRA